MLEDFLAALTEIHGVLQGLGDSGQGWQPVAQMISRDPSLHHVKWVLPHALVSPIPWPSCNVQNLKLNKIHLQTHCSRDRERRDDDALLVRAKDALRLRSSLTAHGTSHVLRFDIYEFGAVNPREDEDGMLKTVHNLNQLISAEVDGGIPANRIVLGGFSQGAAMTLLTGVTTERRLAGLAVLSGWLPLREKIKAVSAPLL